jgi:5'-AMP-activated protein kinase regulatory gamma subunit
MAPPRVLTHDEALDALRAFLKERSSYDVFPVSFRLIVLDTQLKVKKALDVMLLYGELKDGEAVKRELIKRG